MIRLLLLVMLLVPVLSVSGADIIRRKAGDQGAPYRIEFIYAQIDSIVGGVVYGESISPPGYSAPDSVTAEITYEGRDTTETALVVNMALVDTLKNVSIALDSTRVQGTALLIGGLLKPRNFVVDSAAAAADSIWLLGR